MKTPVISLILFSICAQCIHAQIEITNSVPSVNQLSLNGTYSQSFDTLVVSGTASAWVNNSTLTGWYATDSNINYLNGPGLFSSGTAGERSMGINTNSQLGVAAGNRTNSIGLRFINGTSSIISIVSVAFDGEQWARGANSPQIDYSLFFSYQIFVGGSGNISTSSGWTFIPTLTFTAPNATLTTSALLDGDDPTNRTSNINGFINGIELAQGDEVWLRWTTMNLAYPKVYHALTIDNLSVTFGSIPEPASYATFTAVGALAVAVVCRRRQKRL
jgi:hypothetical protein